MTDMRLACLRIFRSPIVQDPRRLQQDRLPLTDEELPEYHTASAGNHDAQGVAYAARERGAKANIRMPTITPPLKVDATKAWCRCGAAR